MLRAISGHSFPNKSSTPLPLFRRIKAVLDLLRPIKAYKASEILRPEILILGAYLHMCAGTPCRAKRVALMRPFTLTQYAA